MKLVALDVALLPPPDVNELALQLSASLPAVEGQGLRLDASHLPHITLTQHFVPERSLAEALEQVDEIVRGQSPLFIEVTGGAKGSSSVWMGIARSPELRELHERLMNRLRRFEHSGGGTVAAFAGGDARPGDVRWVSDYRRRAAFAAFTPHVTLGHARKPPQIAPFTFIADRVAACHLGRFCSCRRVLREWTLSSAQPTSTAGRDTE